MTQTSSDQIENQVRQNLTQVLFGVEIPAPCYRGKVRDVFDQGNELIIVTTDRVSAFDVVLGAVPYKGALLTEQAVFWLNKSRDVIANHLVERLDDQIIRCKKAENFRVEMVVRGYLAGSLLRETPEKRGVHYGLQVDPGMRAYERFNEPIVTPTTKADAGEHDLPISLSQIVSDGLATQQQLDEMVAASIALFKLGSAFAAERDLLLVDTKYEFGVSDGRVILIDEIHTADSSRYWIASSYHDALAQNKTPQMLDKERLRTRLIEAGYDGADTATLPKLDDAMRIDLACHYWQLTEKLTGHIFCPATTPAASRVSECLSRYFADASLQM